MTGKTPRRGRYGLRHYQSVRSERAYGNGHVGMGEGKEWTDEDECRGFESSHSEGIRGRGRSWPGHEANTRGR